MKRIVIAFLIFCLLIISGCNDYREIERGYLVNSIGISKTNQNATIYLEAQTTSLTDKSLEKIILTNNGHDLNEAFKNLKSQLVKPLYFEQMAVVVFDGPPVQADLAFLTNKLKINYGIYIVNSNNIKAIFEHDSPSSILGYDIITLIKNYEKENNESAHCRLFEVLKHKPVLPNVNLIQDTLILSFTGERV